MLSWFQALMPREDRFFPMFARHAATLVAGAEALRDLLHGTCAPAEGCDRIVKSELQADSIAAEVLMAVRRSFITPFDRGDIKDLIGVMDDSIDQMQKTAKAITIFEVTSFQPQMQEIGELIVRAAKLTAEAIGLLGSMKLNASRLNSITEQIIKLEGESDDLHDLGIKSLFKNHGQASPMDYIVGAEIYDHLEKVLDRFEDVANRVSGILIESV
ncbi:MAG TPA: DUF47 domain-containing protein [Rhizomicrobium sp.]|nr:DUF47 domain-containing protein [Rhizomicrobium sp.]